MILLKVFSRIKYYFKLYPLSFILLLILTLLTLIPPIWGYDEYASVITHLELNDSRFIQIYNSYLSKIGIKGSLADSIISYILPIIIIPVRWTYALGLSPLYELARLIKIDWIILRPLLLFLHSLLAVIGYTYIIKSLRFYIRDTMTELMLTGLILLSLPFLYWTLTLSSYSFHLFCFGILIYYEINDEYSLNKILSKKTLVRCLVILFNYQYIFIVLTLFVLDLVKNRFNFFSNKIYKPWILPLILAVGTLFFLFIRGIIFSKHTNPAKSVINNLGTDSYNVLSHTNSLNDFVTFFSSRLYDIVKYFFQNKDYHKLLSDNYSNLNFYISFLIIILLLYFLYKLFKSTIKLLNVIFVFFLSSICLYLVNLYPMMPSRHSLVLFLPLITLFSFFYSQRINKKIKKIISITFFILAIVTICRCYKISSKPLNKTFLINTLKTNNINRLVLSPCDEEPLFYSEDVLQYKPLYQCGPMIIEKIDIKENINIAVYSKNVITFDRALEIAKPFIKKDLTKHKFSLIKQVIQPAEGNYEFLFSSNSTHTFTIIKID